MTYRGTVKQGVVVLEGGVTLDEGTTVEVHPLPRAIEPAAPSPTIWDKLLKLAGSVPGLPADAAPNHDHYLYGSPKRPSPDAQTPDR
jgi:hypothetical protein